MSEGEGFTGAGAPMTGDCGNFGGQVVSDNVFSGATYWSPSSCGSDSCFTTTSAPVSSEALVFTSPYTATTGAAGDAQVAMPNFVAAETIQAPAAAPLEQGKQPVISVVPAEAGQPADYKVRANGTVEKAGEPLSAAKGEIKIQVEQGASQEKVDQLVAHVKQELEKAGAKPTLNAGENLVSEQVKSSFPVADDADFDPSKGGEGGTNGGGGDCNGGNCNRGDGGGGNGGGGRGETDIPDEKQDIPPLPNEQEEIKPNVSMRNPYDNLRDSLIKNENAGFMGWWGSMLTKEELDALGNPPDPEKLKALLNSPKFKERMAARKQALKDSGDTKGVDQFTQMEGKLGEIGSNDQQAKNFSDFMGRMSSGQPDANNDMEKFFNSSQMKEATVNSQILDAQSKLGVNLKSMPVDNAANIQKADAAASDVALTMLLGRAPTAADRANTKFAEYLAVQKQNLEAARGSSN